MKKIVGLRAKTYSYIVDDGSQDKKAKSTKKCIIKGKLKIRDYKIGLEAAQIENIINHLEENKIDIDTLKQFIKTIN